MKQVSNLNIVTYSAKGESLFSALKTLWFYKNLIWVFAKRDLQVKYAQTYLGFTWSVFKPLLGLSIYTFFFGFILHWESEGIVYPIYVLSGLISWNLFTYIVGNGSSAILESNELIKKIYFPKSILPISKSLVGLIESGISFIILIPLLFYYEINISWKIIFLPLTVLFTLLLGLSATFIISSFSIKKRDLLQVLPFILNMAIWFAPVFFTIDILPEKLQFLMKFNPIANMVDAWRWTMFDYKQFELTWLINFILAILISIVSYYIYNKREQKFADFA